MNERSFLLREFMKDTTPTPEFLQAFADAWNQHDADLLMTFMTQDCIFDSSAGPLVHGTRYEGWDAVKAGYAAIWETFPDAQWLDAEHFVMGDRGVSEWTFKGTTKDGKVVEARGCDLFVFKNGKIKVKDSFRKNRSV
tara:strand:- start:126312 stop:126725 length:414 start_codon:yes stop_codon:yes gene_type:complete